MKTGNIDSNAMNEQEGRYANYFKVGHNAFEFILDFGQLYAENEDVKFFTRIITNPKSAKNFVEVLEQSIMQYEQNHGAIGIQNQDL